MAAARRHRFKLLAGHPALNFVNTVRDWTIEIPHDYLGDFGDALRFGETAGFLTHGEVLRFRDRNPQIEFRKLKELRLLLRRIFGTCVGGAPNKEDLERLGSDLAETAPSTRLTVGARIQGSRLLRVKREIIAEHSGESLLRFRIVEAAVGLLVSDGMLPRLKSCPACGWFFLDASKNRSRRWCSMRTCGSVAKARSYYRRTKATATARKEIL